MAGVPKDRFNHEAFYHPNPGKTGAYHAAGGYFLDGDLASFDAPFFSLTEKEALASTYSICHVRWKGLYLLTVNSGPSTKIAARMHF